MVQNFFKKAVETGAPTAGAFDGAMVLGKKIAVQAALAAFAVIGTGAAHGTVNMSEAAKASNAAHFDVVTPPAFMQRDSTQTYTQSYKYDTQKNEDIGSARVSDPKLPAPSGP